MIKLIICGLLFVLAYLLAFPPIKLRKWPSYLFALTIFIISEIYLQWAVFEMLSAPDFDDGASAMFISPMMLFPTVLLIFLFALRLAQYALKQLLRFILNNNRALERIYRLWETQIIGAGYLIIITFFLIFIITLGL